MAKNNDFESIFKNALSQAKQDIKEKRTITLKHGIDFHICVLIEQYNMMSSQFIYNLNHFYEIKVWPKARKFDFDPMVKEWNWLMDEDRELYLGEINEKIKSSNIIVAFVTNSFCKSPETIKLIQHAKDLKKPLIALVVEEIENYEEIKSTTLNGFVYYCEIYRARFNKVTYDYFLWISQYFVDFRVKIEHLLGKKLSKKILQENLFENDEPSNKLYFFYTMDHSNCLPVVNQVIENFRRVQDDYITYWWIPQGIYKSFKDLKSLNIDCKLLEKEYVHDSLYSYYDAILESKNIGCKNDYLTLFQKLDYLINLKLIELIKSENIQISVNEKTFYEHIEERIDNLARINQDYISKTENLSSGDEKKFKKDLKNSILEYIEQEFKKLNISLKIINYLFAFIHKFSPYSDINELYETNVIVIHLFKQFYESGKFTHFFKNIVSIKKQVFILKLEEFTIDENIFDDNAEYICGIYDLYHHANDDFDGYQLRRLFDDISNHQNLRLEIHKLKIKIRDQMFLLYPIETEENTFVRRFKDQLEEKKLKFLTRIEIKDENNEAVNDKIQSSKLTVFFLTNEYIKSGDFQKYYEFAKKAKNMYLVVVMEPIILDISHQIRDFDLSQFNVIHAYLPEDESNDRFWYLISKKLVKKEVNDENHIIDTFIYKNLIKTGLKSNENKNDEKIKIFDMPINNHLIIFYESKFYIFDRKTTHFKDYIYFDLDYDFHLAIKDMCYAKCVDQIFFCISGFRNYQYLFVMDRDYTNVRIFSNFRFGRMISICYHENSETLYILSEIGTSKLRKTLRLSKGDLEEGLDNCVDCFDIDDEEENHLRGNDDDDKAVFYEYYLDCYKDLRTKIGDTVKSMLVLNDSIYYLTSSEIYVFDLNLSYVTQFGLSNIKYASRILISSLSNYMFVADQEGLKMFNLNTFEYIGTIKATKCLFKDFSLKETAYNIFIGDYLINISYKNTVGIVKTIFNPKNTVCVNNDKYLCKMNPFKHHLLKNPYELSCGNIYCISCIYEQFNIFTNKFKCGHEECKEEHFWDRNKFKISKIFEENFHDIHKSHIEYFEQKISKSHDDKAEKLETLENRFELLENDLEIRFESLKVEIDDQSNKLLKKIEKFEKHLVMSKDYEPEKKIKRYEYERFSYGNCYCFEKIITDKIGSTDLIPTLIKLSQLE